MTPVELVLFIIATIFFGLAAFGVAHPRFHFGWGGLLLVSIAAFLLPAL